MKEEGTVGNTAAFCATAFPSGPIISLDIFFVGTVHLQGHLYGWLLIFTILHFLLAPLENHQGMKGGKQDHLPACVPSFFPLCSQKLILSVRTSLDRATIHHPKGSNLGWKECQVWLPLVIHGLAGCGRNTKLARIEPHVPVGCFSLSPSLSLSLFLPLLPTGL
ncbi:hypothetical protein E2320_011848, partial [Naja naja]